MNERNNLIKFGIDLATFTAILASALFVFGSAYQDGYVKELGIDLYLVKIDLHSLLMNGFVSFFTTFLLVPVSTFISFPLLAFSCFLYKEDNKHFFVVLITFVVAHMFFCIETGHTVAKNNIDRDFSELKSDKASLTIVTHSIDNRDIVTKGLQISLPSDFIFLRTDKSIVAIPKSKVVKIEISSL